MAYKQADLDALTAAIATGTRRVTINGRTVEYGSLDDMLRVKAMIERDLGVKPATPSRTFAAFSRGT